MSLDALSKKDRLRLMKFVCSFAWADLKVVEAERQMVNRLIRRLDLDDDERAQVDQWLEVPPKPEEIDPTEIPLEHRTVFLESARRMIAVDGEIAVEEYENLSLFDRLLR